MRMRFSIRSQRIARDIGGLDQTLLAARDISDDDHRAPHGAFGIERMQDIEFQLTFST
jgi:hypothetical protein